MFDQFRKTINLLRKEIPPAFPVSVRRTRLKGLDGYCQKVGERFVIGINKDLSERLAIETLVHEWAHARAWTYLYDKMTNEEFHKKVHDASWGVAYAEVYRVYEASLTNESNAD